jgi:hypothetical protein
LQLASLTVVPGGVLGDAGGWAEVVVPGGAVVGVVLGVAVELDVLELDVVVDVGALPAVPQAARTAVTIAMPAAAVARFTVRSLSAPPQRVIGCEEASPLRRTSYPR